MERHSVLVIVNPVARRAPARTELDEMLRPLRDEGHSFEIELTASPGDATRIAAQSAGRGYTRVAACGGDGTLNEVLNGLDGQGAVTGLLPAGTGNVWAKEVGIPWDLKRAARILVEAPARRIDLGRANGRRFLLMCGIGYDGAVTARVPSGWKRRLGSTSYLLAGVPELRRFKPVRAVFELDGQEQEAEFFMAVVGNSRSYGGVVNITKRAFVDDGLLDVCAFGGGSFWRLSRDVTRIAMGNHMNTPAILYHRVRRLRLPLPGIPLQVDGDAFGESPLEVEVEPAAVSMVIPDGQWDVFAHPPRRN
ncbi:MAG: YegS/Rv2252/BmrU family lipid kinase [Dehalococcoidia bacterium]|nr:YegS/Rv2252/BmrU family lipid kinase [Dehalococcoidia bacterium]